MWVTRTFIAFGALALALGVNPAAAQQAPTAVAVTAPAAPAAIPAAPPPPPVIAVVPPPPPPHGIPGSFESLPRGERAIADALYEAQRGPHRWSRDQIATAKLSGDGWGQIFHEMRRDGLIHAKSLGQVIRRDGDRHLVRRDRDDFGRRDRDDFGHHDHHNVAHHHHHEITVTSASGASQVVSQGGWRHGGWNTGAGSHATTHSTGTATASAHHTPTGAQFSETAMASGNSAAMHHGAAAHHGR